MSSGLYNHTTRATGTILTAAIYNADHQNHINNQNPTMTGALSDSVLEYQSEADPGGISSENLASSLAGEIQRLRYVIKRFLGASQWYEDLGIAVFTASANLFTITQAITTNLVNLILNRTENDTVERELVSLRSGSGAGLRGSLRLVGGGANDVAALRLYIGTVPYGFKAPGEIDEFAGTVAPPDHLMCYGQAVSRITHAPLFAAIGTAHGVGDGSLTFNVPDRRDVVSAGKGNMGGVSSTRLLNASADTLGAVIGTETHTNEQQGSFNTGGPSANNATGSSGAAKPTSDHTHVVTISGPTAAGSSVQPTIMMNFIIYSPQV